MARDDHPGASYMARNGEATNDAYDKDTDSVSRAQRVLRHQAAALLACADRLATPPSRAGYDAALRILHDTVGALEDDCDSDSDDTDAPLRFRPRGKIITTGVGKSAHIARKVTATLQSLATPAVFLHPTEAVHGDLGLVSGGDALLVFSHSGRTDELVRLLAIVRGQRRPCRVIAVCGDPDSPIARAADAWVDAAVGTESDRALPAPTASTTLALALGDAIALGLAQARGVGAREFARHHPGGNLGRVLAKCTETRVREAVTVGDKGAHVELAYTEKVLCSVLATEPAAVHSVRRVEVSTSEQVEVDIAYKHEATAPSETKRGADQRTTRGIDVVTPGTESVLHERVDGAYDAQSSQLPPSEAHPHNTVGLHQTSPITRAAPIPHHSTRVSDSSTRTPDRSTGPDLEALDTTSAPDSTPPHTPSAPSVDSPVPDLSAPTDLDALDPDPLDTGTSSDSGSSRPRTPSAPADDSDSDREVCGRLHVRSISPSRYTATTTTTTTTGSDDFALFDDVAVGLGARATTQFAKLGIPEALEVPWSVLDARARRMDQLLEAGSE